MALILTGPTISVWGPKLTAPLRAAAQGQALRRLHPLWLALTTAMPYLRKQSPHALGDALAYRLYRRIIEIRDGLLILEPYRDLRLEQLHAAGTAAAVAAHASSIASALRTYSASGGEDAADRVANGDNHSAISQETGEHAGAVIAPAMPLMKDEIAYLKQLSRAFARLEKRS